MTSAPGFGACPVCGRRGLRLVRRAKVDVRPVAPRAHYPKPHTIGRDYCPGSCGPPERNS